MPSSRRLFLAENGTQREGVDTFWKGILVQGELPVVMSTTETTPLAREIRFLLRHIGDGVRVHRSAGELLPDQCATDETQTGVCSIMLWESPTTTGPRA
ncbi:hypothetical protein AVEN_85158-1, partial [Araneus ventricosus]